MISYFVIFAALAGAEQAEPNVQVAVDNVKDPVDTINEPVDTVQAAVGTIKDPVDTVQAAVGTIKDPVDTVQAAVDTIKEPVGTINEPVDTIIKDPVDTVPAAVDTIKEPVGTINEPVDILKDPVENVKDPVHTVEEADDDVDLSALRDNSEEKLITLPNGETMTREMYYGGYGTFNKFSLTSKFMLDPERWQVILMFDRESQDDDADDVQTSMTKLAEVYRKMQMFWLDMENPLIRNQVVPLNPCKNFPCVTVQNVKLGNYTLSFARELESCAEGFANSVEHFILQVTQGEVTPYRSHHVTDDDVDEYIKYIKELILAQEYLSSKHREETDQFEYSARQLEKKNSDDEAEKEKLAELRNETSLSRKWAKKEKKLHDQLANALEEWLAIRAEQQIIRNKLIIETKDEKTGKKVNVTELTAKFEELNKKSLDAVSRVLAVQKKCVRGEEAAVKNRGKVDQWMDKYINPKSDKKSTKSGKKSTKSKKQKAHGDDGATDANAETSVDEGNGDAATEEVKTDSPVEAVPEVVKTESPVEAASEKIASEEPEAEAENVAEPRKKDEL